MLLGIRLSSPYSPFTMGAHNHGGFLSQIVPLRRGLKNHGELALVDKSNTGPQATRYLDLTYYVIHLALVQHSTVAWPLRYVEPLQSQGPTVLSRASH